MQPPTFTASLHCSPHAASEPSLSSFLISHSPSAKTLCSHVHTAGLPLCPLLCVASDESVAAGSEAMCANASRALAKLSDALDLIGLSKWWFIGCWGGKHTWSTWSVCLLIVQTYKVCKRQLVGTNSEISILWCTRVISLQLQNITLF